MNKYRSCILTVCCGAVLLTGCRTVTDAPVLPETVEIQKTEETVPEPAGEEQISTADMDELTEFLTCYNAAMSVYLWFYWGCDWIGHGEEQVRIGNAPYYIVEDPAFEDLGIDTIADLRAYLRNFFTEAFTDTLLSQEIFTDIDGRLHIVGASRGGGAWREAREFLLLPVSETRKDLVCRAAFYPTGSREPEEELREYVFPFVWENGNWLLDDWPAMIRSLD